MSAAEGQPAPALDLPTDGGGRVTLAALKGKPAVVYFYPKDDTTGCTREAQDFTALAPTSPLWAFRSSACPRTR